MSRVFGNMKYLLLIVLFLAAPKAHAFWGLGSVNYSNVSIVDINALLYPFSDYQSNSYEPHQGVRGLFVEPSLGLAGSNLFVGYGHITGESLPVGYEIGGLVGRSYLFNYGVEKNRMYYGAALKSNIVFIPIKIGLLVDEEETAKVMFEIGLGF